MSDNEADGQAEIFQDEDHKPAYIFNPLEDGEQIDHRPPKRRKVSSKKEKVVHADLVVESSFVPLFGGKESDDCVSLREELFNQSWSSIDSRVNRVLREANTNTLDEVGSFLQDAAAETDKIPAAFIITGRNIASQDLLFEQLADTLRATTHGRFVRIRSAEAPNLKSVLKKIIKDATARTTGDEDDAEVSVGADGRKYLDYDLEALYASVKTKTSQCVNVAFQDSEAFDGNMLSELMALFRSWQDRIQFTVLFGIATSVELFQARLSKSTAQHLYGGQFDVVQANSVLENVFRDAIVSPEVRLRLGPSLLRSLVERQHDQIAGIHAFTSSVKYAYMCHFYANPLSILISKDEDRVRKLLQPEHLVAIRTLDSYKEHVEQAVDAGQLNHARSLLEDDQYLVDEVLRQLQLRQVHIAELLRSLNLMTKIARLGSFMELYMTALAEGIDTHTNAAAVIDAVKRRTPEELIALCSALAGEMDEVPGAPGSTGDLVVSPQIAEELLGIARDIGRLDSNCRERGKVLKSSYHAQKKVVRATVVAHKVQLSQDSATLTKEDQEFTSIIDDRFIKLLDRQLSSASTETQFLHESYVYDSKMPYRDVFMPRPGTTIKRALSRPHDYLSCSCCSKADGAIASTLPATSILYQLYGEAGALVNVSDLWSAFYSVVGDESEDGERHALVQFYRALSELRILGFVKQTKKKVDHVAKLKWL